MKHLLLILFGLFIFGCNTKSDVPIGNIICKNLQKQNTYISLSLFISEEMCSDCINTEFKNIKEYGELINSLVIVGSFSNKRHFESCVNSIIFDKPIQKVLIKSEVGSRFKPFYFIYHSDSNSISDIFYPTSCDRALTVNYYSSVKK
jgi:hypothetical protein